MTNISQDNPVFAAAIEAVATPLFVLDEQGRYLEALGAADGQAADVVGHRLHDVLPEDVADELLVTLQAALDSGRPETEEYRIPSTNGDEDQWYLARFAPIPAHPGEPRRVVYVAVDITRQKQLEQRLEMAAGTDPLTGVGNQRRFIQAVEDEVARASRYSEPFCLLMLELDHFDTVRERYGEEASDRSLRALARLIRQELRHSDILGRLEDAEFGVLLTNTPLRWGLEVAERIRLRTARSPFSLPGKTLQLTVSGGVTEFHNGESASEILWRAEEALYKSGSDSDNRISVAQ